MIGGIWRRLRRAIQGGAPRERYRPDLPHGPGPPTGGSYGAPYLSSASSPTFPLEGSSRPAATPVAPVAPAAPSESLPPLEQLVERYSTRLVEDEGLRGNLTDDEFQPLLRWAETRLAELATVGASLSPDESSARFQQAARQLLELLRVIDLAIGQRAEVGPELASSRFELIDTLLVPPLFDATAGELARARLEALLAQPAERLQSMDGDELARRLVDALG